MAEPCQRHKERTRIGTKSPSLEEGRKPVQGKADGCFQKSKAKMKSRLKELTSRSNGWGYAKRKQKLMKLNAELKKQNEKELPSQTLSIDIAFPYLTNHSV